MKKSTLFTMIAVCMMVFTSTAATAKMEQKQKTEFVQTFDVPTNAVSVVNDFNAVDFYFVSTDATNQKVFKVKSFEVKQPIISEATIKDVGWRSKETLTSNYFYQKSRYNYLMLPNSSQLNCKNSC